MREVIYYPIHGNRRGGTGLQCYGGFAYGVGDAVTLKPDEPTDLFAPSLTTKVEKAAARSAGDSWVFKTPIGQTVHTQGVKPAAAQPPTVALTAKQQGGVVPGRVTGRERAELAKTTAQAAKIQRAIESGRLHPQDALAKAERAAEHAAGIAMVAHSAYNAIAILGAKIQQDLEAGKDVGGRQKALVNLRRHADRLDAIARRDRALAAAAHAAMPLGVSGLGQNEGETTDARDGERYAAELVVQAANEISEDNIGAAEVTLANAEGAFQSANRQMSAEAAAGDVFAQVSAALDPNAVPWGKIGVAILILAALRQATR